MSAHRATSTLCQDITFARETAVQKLAGRISQAVEDTRGGIKDDDAPCFLPRSDLAVILNRWSVRGLIMELVPLREDSKFAPAVNEGDSDGVSLANLEITRYIDRTLGTPFNPPRVALLALALFLYTKYPPLLRIFTEWLINPGLWPNFPSDNDLPLKESTLEANIFPVDHDRSILKYQNIFRPVSIRQGEYREFESMDRLPYIGKRESIKKGSSGSVFKVMIAQDHWEIRSQGRYVSGNPYGPLAMAIKEFKEVPNWRSMKEATEDFDYERKILKEIRESQIRHKMVMLDLGSISILGGEGVPISHSIIFELATCSLGDFLTDELRAKEYKKRKSVVFAKLADVVAALAYLHDYLGLLHLDIKPDNILVFVREPSDRENENEYKENLVWKLSDFGLARKKDAKVGIGLSVHYRYSSYQESQSSNMPATRPAGPYQAPEVQEQGSSGVGKRSDVWSMGCVTLMVLAFVVNGVTEVRNLEKELSVRFMDWGGSQSLFYHRSDSYKWRGGLGHIYTYMEDFHPDIGDIPDTLGTLKAAVHPDVIIWSNALHDFCADQSEQVLVRDILKVIFRHVLRIRREDRISAKKLAEEMSDFKTRWRFCQDLARDSLDPLHSPDLSGAELPEPSTNEDDIYSLSEQFSGPILEESPNHSHICQAIKSDDESMIIQELERHGVKWLKEPCGFCKKYPIHTALRSNAYRSLKALADASDPDVANITCPESGETAIELASSSPGKSKALEIFLSNSTTFGVTKEFYDKHVGNLDTQSKKNLKKLVNKPQTQPAGRSFFGKRR